MLEVIGFLFVFFCVAVGVFDACVSDADKQAARAKAATVSDSQRQAIEQVGYDRCYRELGGAP